MKSNYLLPAKFKKFGWMLLIPSVILGILNLDWGPGFLDVWVFAISFDSMSANREVFDIIEHNIFPEILCTSIIVGGLTVAFSREFDEDELISSMRLDSLVWAIYWNYGILAIAFILFYGMSFFTIMVFNMFTPLLLFIIRFNWLIMKFRNSLKDEE